MSFFRRLTDERGVALPVALAVLVTVAGLATVAARAAIVSNNQSFRDNNAKRAVQGANAGLQAAVYQTNLLQPSSTQCVHKAVSDGALSNGALQANTWCQPQTEDLGDGAGYTFQISSPSAVTTSTGLSVDQRKVVAYGTVNGVRRRATVTINAATGTPQFPPGYVITVRESVDLKNNAQISGHIGSNGTITIKNNATVCGNVTPGPGKVAKIGSNFTQCAGYNRDPAAEPFNVQPVDLSLVKPPNPNDNGRLSPLNSAGKDTCSNCNKISWSTATRVLTVDKDGVLNLAGDNYLVCRLEVKSGGTVQIVDRSAKTAPLRIYVDTPENCGSGSGMGSVIWDGQLVNLYSYPYALAILPAGSSTKSTLVDLPTNDASSPIAIYAPNSTVNMKNNVQFTGAIVAKTLTLMNNAKFTWDATVNGVRSGSDIRFYQAATGSYKECTTAATGTAPDSGC